MISYYTYLPVKAVMWNLSSICSIPNVSLLIVLCLFSMLVRLLLANIIGLSMVLPGEISLGHVASFLACNRVALSPTPDASVSKY